MFSSASDFLSFEVLVFVLPSAFVCVAIGGFLGYSFALNRIPKQVARERKKTVEALQTVLRSADQLTEDVGHHNTELKSVEESVSGLEAGGDLESMQTALLSEISAVMNSNRRMADDLVVTRYQLEEQAQELDKTRLEARTDDLSGLNNRKGFDEALQFAVSQFNRKGVNFSLLLADVDHFKRINDTHGHQAGDYVVTHLGNLLTQLSRKGDYLARYGGDEFALLLIGASDEQARVAANRLHAAIGSANFDVGLEQGHVAVTVSMGMAFACAGDTATTIIERADKALYRSKQGGRNQVHFWNNVPAAPACV